MTTRTPNGFLAVGGADEIARFDAFVVRGPVATDCWIWTGAIADDGYGRFWIQRDGRQRVVRPNRYALARWIGPVPADRVAMHGVCDNPICVRVEPGSPQRSHVMLGTQSANLASMGAKGRSGGAQRAWMRNGLDREQRAARSYALREAVRNGWDDAAVLAVLSNSGSPGLFRLDTLSP